MFENTTDIPVTGPFLSLVKALHSARSMFISESAMAEELSLDHPCDWNTRCRDLFFTQYKDAAARMGLQANEQTFEALMRLKVPEAAWHTSFNDLPKKFIFNPWAGMGHGGIKVIGQLGNLDEGVWTELEKHALRKPLEELYELWNALGNVPVSNRNDKPGADTIEAPFLHFAAGTNREDIWHWFEAQNPGFIVGDVMQGIRR